MALMLLALPGISTAAEHGGMGDMQKGEKIFVGKVGPWPGEARLVDMKAQMEQSGVSAKTAARFAGRRHLMLFLTDPAIGKPAAGVSGTVAITGPDKASSSKVTLIVMGEHIGADVGMPTPGKYTFKAEIESAGKKGSATFSYTLK
jgi:hypothetical protein